MLHCTHPVHARAVHNSGGAWTTQCLSKAERCSDCRNKVQRCDANIFVVLWTVGGLNFPRVQQLPEVCEAKEVTQGLDSFDHAEMNYARSNDRSVALCKSSSEVEIVGSCQADGPGSHSHTQSFTHHSPSLRQQIIWCPGTHTGNRTTGSSEFEQSAGRIALKSSITLFGDQQTLSDLAISNTTTVREP